MRRSIFTLLSLLIATGAIGATSTGVFNVRLTVAASCAVGAVADIDHGSVTALTSTVDALATLQMTCTSGAPYNIGLSSGQHGTGVSDRKMKVGTGTETVNYQLYRDAARTQVWGETLGTDTMAGVGTGTAQSQTIYSRVLAQPGLLRVGVYTDTVTVTVTY